MNFRHLFIKRQEALFIPKEKEAYMNLYCLRQEVI